MNNAEIFYKEALKRGVKPEIINAYHDVVIFKFWAAEFFLNKLKEIHKNESVLTEKSHKEARAYLDGFLFELVSSIDIFLQEINVAFNINLPITTSYLLDKLLKIKPNSTGLNKLSNLMNNKNYWLYQLMEYRRHTTHRGFIGRHIYSGGDKDGQEYFKKDPKDSKSPPANKEIIPYCDESILQMKKLIDELYADFVKEL